MAKMITALLDTRAETDLVLSHLETAGLSDSQVSVLMTEDVRNRHFQIAEGTKAPEGAVAGATIGGLATALYMALFSGGALLLPGVLITGGLVAAVTGLGAGAAAGGLVGALVGLGIPEHEAKLYDQKLSHGSILISIRAETDAQEERVKQILKTGHAHDIKAMAA